MPALPLPNGKEPHDNSAIALQRLESVVKTGDYNARLHLASTPNTPGEILALLGADVDPRIRLIVAKNPATPHHIVAKLARDAELSVRMGLATDPNSPVEILTALADDTDERVREASRKTRRVLLATHRNIFNVAFT